MIVDAHVHSFVFEEFPLAMRWAFANNWGWMVNGGPRPGRGPLIPAPEQRRGPFRDPAAVLPRTSVRSSDADGSELFAYMDKLGVDKCIAMMVDWGIAWGEQAEFDIEEVNAHAGVLKKKYPGRYYFCAGADPRRRMAADIAEKAIRDHGASGIKLLAAHGFSPDDSICNPIYEVADAYQVPIVIHTGSGDVAAYAEPAQPFRIEKPAKLFPQVQFVMAHAAGGLDGNWREILIMKSTIPNIAVDLAEWQYPIMPSHLDNGREEEFLHTLNILRRRMGPHNIMFATDFTPDHSLDVDGYFIDIFKDLPARGKKFGYNFSEEEAEAMRGGNAQRIFGAF